MYIYYLSIVISSTHVFPIYILLLMVDATFYFFNLDLLDLINYVCYVRSSNTFFHDVHLTL